MKKYKGELNPDNPLGHHGAVANAYANLLNEMYNDSASTSFTPRQFKNTISKYGAAFSGYGQQDSQEFLLFLLDGLQEDLNRIKKKPYIEKPDSTDEMVHDPAALRAMADKCWEIYKARNDSVVTDLFAGMYKSTVVCPVCDKVSIIFDPFNNLTLQLPIENVWSHKVWYFPLRAPPVTLDVDIDKNATFMALKEYVANKVGVDVKKTIALEVYKSKFYKLYDDKSPIIDERIQESDDVGIFELEYPLEEYPAIKKKQKKALSFIRSDEEDTARENEPSDKLLVAVFHRTLQPAGKYHQGEQWTYDGIPILITLTTEELQDYDEVLRKVLKGIEPLTTRDFLKEVEESEEESDMVVMNAEEADSSSDSKVHTKSVASEDGMVDISVRDSGEESSTAPTPLQPLELPKPLPLPPMLRPRAFITPEVRTLFDMMYYRIPEGDMIPYGFQSLNDDHRCEPLISRRPHPTTEKPMTNREKINRELENRDEATSSDEDAAAPPLIQGYDSDSSDGLPPVAQLQQSQFNRNSRSNGKLMPRKKLITYSRKDKRSSVGVKGKSPDSKGPIINFGEAIVLDWKAHGWDALFNGDSRDRDDFRGVPQWNLPYNLPDPAREKKRKLRDSRKKHGISLEDCLDEFGKSETLSENDAWYCPRCKEHRRATKTFELWRAPDILVVHLKRFSTQGRLRDKLDVLVDFPVEGLDLSSRVSIQEKDRDSIYDLFAVDNHYGGLGGGHYTAYAKNFFDNMWYEYNGKP